MLIVINMVCSTGGGRPPPHEPRGPAFGGVRPRLGWERGRSPPHQNLSGDGPSRS